MNNIFPVCAISVIAAIIALAFKKDLPQYSIIISISAGIFVISSIVVKSIPLIQKMQNIFIGSNFTNEYTSVLLKTLVICFLSEFSAQCCRDAGQLALGSKIELFGKISIIFTIVPLIEKILSMIKGM